jgi:hypothetical protein
MDVKEIGYECVDWIHVVQDMIQWQGFVKTISWKAGNFLSWNYQLLKNDLAAWSLLIE